VVITKIHDNFSFKLDEGENDFDEGDRIKFDKGISVVVRKRADGSSSQDSNSKPLTSHNSRNSPAKKTLNTRSNSNSSLLDFLDAESKKETPSASLKFANNTNSQTKSPHSSPSKRLTRQTSHFLANEALANTPLKFEIGLHSITLTQLILYIIQKFESGIVLSNLVATLERYDCLIFFVSLIRRHFEDFSIFQSKLVDVELLKQVCDTIVSKKCMFVFYL
jgi:hypothetical protein